MHFDWLTWIIWGIGVAVFIFWIVFPVQEFIKLMKEQMKR